MTAGPWSSLSPTQHQWLVINAILVPAVINAVLNGTIAWAVTESSEPIPAWSTSETSVGTDTLATLFLLPLITCVLVTTVVWHEIRTGKLERTQDAGWLHLLAGLPSQRVLRGIAIGALSFTVLAAPVTLALVLTGLGDLAQGEFIAYKAAFGVALGAIVTPLIAIRAMADRVGREPPGN